MHADPNFINNPALRSLTEQNFMDCIWMNPEDARELGVEEGEMIRLENNPRFMTGMTVCFFSTDWGTGPKT